jgi:hypothetical protein
MAVSRTKFSQSLRSSIVTPLFFFSLNFNSIDLILFASHSGLYLLNVETGSESIILW